MPYTLTKLLLWLLGAAVLGGMLGYLFRGRPPVIDPAHHPSAGKHLRATDDDELGRLRQKVDRLETQLSLAIAERDRLRYELEHGVDPDEPPAAEPTAITSSVVTSTGGEASGVEPAEDEPEDESTEDESTEDESTEDESTEDEGDEPEDEFTEVESSDPDEGGGVDSVDSVDSGSTDSGSTDSG